MLKTTVVLFFDRNLLLQFNDFGLKKIKVIIGIAHESDNVYFVTAIN